MRSVAQDLSVAYPCEVVKFDPETQLVDVRVDFSHVLNLDVLQQVKGFQAQSIDDKAGISQVALEPDIMVNILVSFEGQGRKNGGYITFPIAEGDKGYVTVFDRSVDRWMSAGQGGDPAFSHTHNRIDGVFKPVRDISRAIPNFDGAAAVIEHACIKLGMDATEAAVLGDILNEYIDDLKFYLDAHTHPAPGGATSAPTNPSPTIPDFLSDQVKISKGPQ